MAYLLRLRVNGLFFELHDDPVHAKSDRANALRLDLLKPLLKKVQVIHGAVTA